MDHVIKLGDFIELEGFEDVDGGSMVIIKKMVGNHVKELGERFKDMQKFSVKLEKGDGYILHAVMKAGENDITSESSGTNLFVALDKLFKSMTS